ncbi:Thiol-disulfide isomerase or thioredoxin [Nocardioides alpinus]|nr:TlpA disulfide reductase family protein [Nocardioides alpinus]SFB38115.1 Thiol-disulfide isomerase or thioredoxin [Nocardioides alpinus]
MSIQARRSAIFISIVLVTAVICWVVFTQARVEQPSSSSGSAVTGDLVQQFEPGERPTVAAFEATLLDGGTLNSKSLRGTVTVMNVWGSWCGPCRAEAPDLVDAAQRLGDRAQFYGINVRDSPDAARAFERAFDIPYPSINPDDSARTILAFGGVLTAAAVPSTVVIDADGAVAARVVGQVDASTLIGLVKDASTDPSRAGSPAR